MTIWLLIGVLLSIKWAFSHFTLIPPKFYWSDSSHFSKLHVEWGAKYLSNVNNIPALIFREHLQSIAFDIALLLKPSSVL